MDDRVRRSASLGIKQLNVKGIEWEQGSGNAEARTMMYI